VIPARTFPGVILGFSAFPEPARTLPAPSIPLFSSSANPLSGLSARGEKFSSSKSIGFEFGIESSKEDQYILGKEEVASSTLA